MLIYRDHYFSVKGIEDTKWRVYSQYEIKLVPLIFKFTDEIYEKLYSFMFDTSSDDVAVKLEKELQK